MATASNVAFPLNSPYRPLTSKGGFLCSSRHVIKGKILDCENPALAKLLVSVRDADEAKIALRFGVDWIDLKEPDKGALGAPDLETAEAVARALVDHASRSVALGELADLDFNSAKRLAELFPILKVGLARVADTDDWRDQLTQLAWDISIPQQSNPARLVPVIYADWESCSAPKPEEVFELAGNLPQPSQHKRFVLVDTFAKNGQSLLDHADQSLIQRWIERARDADCHLLLAGSLKEKQVIELSQRPIEAVGVRGAVCGANRRSAICEQKLRKLRSAMSNTSRPSLAPKYDTPRRGNLKTAYRN